jgi:hypothetical protein
MSLKWRVRWLTLLGLGAILATVAYMYRADIAKFIKDQQHLAALRSSKEPVDRAVGTGELRPDESMAEWAAAHPPKYQFRHDQYETLWYEGNSRHDYGLRVVSAKSRVVYAGKGEVDSRYAIFNRLSDDDLADYHASFLQMLRGQIVGQAAVAGVASTGVSSPQDSPLPSAEEAP